MRRGHDVIDGVKREQRPGVPILSDASDAPVIPV
jgi:hypothetical protein